MEETIKQHITEMLTESWSTLQLSTVHRVYSSQQTLIDTCVHVVLRNNSPNFPQRILIEKENTQNKQTTKIPYSATGIANIIAKH